MKSIIRTVICLLCVQGFIALAEGPLTVEEVVKDLAKYDKQEVKVVGKVKSFKRKTSRKGNDYYVFILLGNEEETSALNVYGSGKMDPSLKDGDRVEAWGVFRREKKVMDFTVKNEIDVSAATQDGKKKFGIKLLKQGQ